MQTQTLKELAERLEQRRLHYIERVREIEEENYREFRKSMKSTYEEFLRLLRNDLKQLRKELVLSLEKELREKLEQKLMKDFWGWLIALWVGTILISSIATYVVIKFWG